MKKGDKVLEKIKGFTGAFGYITTDYNVKVSSSSQKITKLLEKDFGICGRMLYGSKTFGREDCEKKGWIFIPNANIFLEGGYKVWHGDFIINKENQKKLKDISKKFKKDLYLLYESKGRFLVKVPDNKYLEINNILNSVVTK